MKRSLSHVVMFTVALLLAAVPLAGCSSDAGTKTAASSQTTSSTAVPAAPRFDAASALKDITGLAKIGVRAPGTPQETQGAEFIVARLRTLGYQPEVRQFTLPDGTTSRNVVARVKGTSSQVIVLGAHMDSLAPSPGADDNASGCAVLLETARAIVGRKLYASVDFVFFGAAEMTGADTTHVLAGSAAYATALTSAQVASTAAMIDVDRVGYGAKFSAGTMGVGPENLADLLVERSQAAGIDLQYLRDPKPGHSDEAAFEKLGVPVAWLSWRTDPAVRTVSDTASRIGKAKVAAAGRVVLDFLVSADGPMLEMLRSP
jgi:hypothetical protein